MSTVCQALNKGGKESTMQESKLLVGRMGSDPYIVALCHLLRIGPIFPHDAVCGSSIKRL